MHNFERAGSAFKGSVGCYGMCVGCQCTSPASLMRQKLELIAALDTANNAWLKMLPLEKAGGCSVWLRQMLLKLVVRPIPRQMNALLPPVKA